MDQILVEILTSLRLFEARSLVDILVVAALIYWLLRMIQGTTAVMLIRGVAIVLLAGSLLSNVMNLTMLSWLLRNAIPALLVAIPILFQPELRRALEQLGRAGGLLPYSPVVSNTAGSIELLASAARRLSERRWGALLVLERGTGLADFGRTGVEIDGSLSVELLLNIFYPNSPLHDGAVIIRGERVLWAGCVLPLTESLVDPYMLGTRHRAGVSITAQTDAVSIIVSEETGQISFANNGRLVRALDEEKLRRILSITYKPPTAETLRTWWRPRHAE